LRGLERHRVDAADERGDGDDERELTIHLPDDSGQKRRRQEHRYEHERDGDNGAEKFVHRGDGGVLWRLAALDVLRRPFDDDDGVVHDDADREHDGEERERVDREAHGRHPRECSDDRHGHGRCGNERRAPVLEEDDDDEQHEQAGLDERLHNFAHGVAHEERVVERQRIFEPLRGAFRQFGELFADALRRLDRVRAGELVDRDAAGRVAVVFGEL
jgi:hypothetical protein